MTSWSPAPFAKMASCAHTSFIRRTSAQPPPISNPEARVKEESVGEVTKLQRKLMHHALGLDNAKRPYRNRYYVHAEGPSVKEWDALTADGLAAKGEWPPRGFMFAVTDAGISALGIPLSHLGNLDAAERFP